MAGIFSEPKGLFKETPGTFSVPKGMFMPEGSKQQDRAIERGIRRDLPTALNPDTPPIKSAMAPLNLGQPDMLMNKKTGRMSGWLGADMGLSPFLSQPGFSIDLLRSGGFGML